MKTMREVNFRRHKQSCNNCNSMDVVKGEVSFISTCSIIGIVNLSTDLFKVSSWNESRVCNEWREKT